MQCGSYLKGLGWWLLDWRPSGRLPLKLLLLGLLTLHQELRERGSLGLPLCLGASYARLGRLTRAWPGPCLLLGLLMDRGHVSLMLLRNEDEQTQLSQVGSSVFEHATILRCIGSSAHRVKVLYLGLLPLGCPLPHEVPLLLCICRLPVPLRWTLPAPLGILGVLPTCSCP